MTGAPALMTNAKKESGPPFSPTSADNGLSVDTTTGKIVLGQDQGAPGDPAQLLSTREILVNSFAIILRQGPFDNTGGFAAIGVNIDRNVGGLVHAFHGVASNDPSDAIIFRATQTDNLCIGAVIQTECSGDAASAVANFGSWGSNAGVPAYRQGTSGILSTAVVNPDVVIQANVKGAPGARPGRVIFATNNLGVETRTYSFLLPVVASLNFPNTLAQTSSDLTVAVPGAALGDVVWVGPPNGSVLANSSYSAWVSAADQVTVRFNNYSAAAQDPAVGNFSVAVVKIL